MNKLHFDDLTKITCPFGLLSGRTQDALRAYAENGGVVEKFTCGDWEITESGMFFADGTYRAEPMPQRMVMWVQWDDIMGAFAAETLGEAKEVQRNDGGYIYRIERDEDGGDPTIELVETGGNDE